MPTLIRKLNYRSISLLSIHNNQPVGVLKRNGELEYLPFMGFTTAVDAKSVGATPVKLEIYGYYCDSQAGELVTLKSGQYVQGALTRVGIYAVLEEGIPRILTRGVGPLDRYVEKKSK